MARDRNTEVTTQQLCARSTRLDLVPRYVLLALILVLLWAVLRTNLLASWVDHWPWRLQLLDVASAAGITGALAALVAARRQFAQTIEPHLGWTGVGQHANSSLGNRTRWYVQIENTGGGLAIITKVEYRITARGADRFQQEWVGPDQAHSRLKALQLIVDTDYALTRIGLGSGIATGASGAFEVLALDEKAYEALEAVDMRVGFDSAAGDHYSRTMYLLPGERLPTIAV